MENLAHIGDVTEILETSISSYLRAETFGRQDMPPDSGGIGKALNISSWAHSQVSALRFNLETVVYPASGKLWDFLNVRLFTISKIPLTF
jgi:hypothetical protein